MGLRLRWVLHGGAAQRRFLIHTLLDGNDKLFAEIAACLVPLRVRASISEEFLKLSESGTNLAGHPFETAVVLQIAFVKTPQLQSVEGQSSLPYLDCVIGPKPGSAQNLREPPVPASILQCFGPVRQTADCLAVFLATQSRSRM